MDTFERAKRRKRELLAKYERPAITLEYEDTLVAELGAIAAHAGMVSIPDWQ
jgi:hypothetical protein